MDNVNIEDYNEKIYERWMSKIIFITIVIYYNRNDTDHKKENSKTKRKNWNTYLPKKINILYYVI